MDYGLLTTFSPSLIDFFWRPRFTRLIFELVLRKADVDFVAYLQNFLSTFRTRDQFWQITHYFVDLRQSTKISQADNFERGIFDRTDVTLFNAFINPPCCIREIALIRNTVILKRFPAALAVRPTF